MLALHKHGQKLEDPRLVGPFMFERQLLASLKLIPQTAYIIVNRYQGLCQVESWLEGECASREARWWREDEKDVKKFLLERHEESSNKCRLLRQASHLVKGCFIPKLW